MARGYRKHRCRDCGNEQMVHWTARARRNRDRCTGCGSTMLDPVTKGGNEDIAAEGMNRKIGPKGSVVLTKTLPPFDKERGLQV